MRVRRTRPADPDLPPDVAPDLPPDDDQPTPKVGPLRWVIPALMGLIILAWQIFVPEKGPTALLLPQPSQIAVRFGQVIANGTLFHELSISTVEIVLGLLTGVVSALLIGYSIARSRRLEQAVGPYLVAFQALPIVAIAPALILWLGPGLASNSVICAFIVFFPMLMSSVVGFKNVDPDHLRLMRALAASRWHIFRSLEVPSALPSLFGGLKISAILAVAGAVVAESVTPLGGLGSLLYAARSRYDSALAFVSVITLTLFALGLFGAVNALERILLRWRWARQVNGL
jgi:NitT/TauT family transport system permease protein